MSPNSMSYTTSTQLNNWIFTTEEINKQRQLVNQTARTHHLELNPKSEHNILKVEDELELINFYERKLIEVSKALALPDKVAATGIVYLKRFYLRNSVMKYTPKLTMICSLFLACKTEDNHIELRNYATEVVKVKPEEILELEIVILGALNFNLIIYHPYRPLHGYILDIFDNQNLFPVTQTLEQMWESSKKWIEKSLLTDLSLQYHPFIIALSCLNLSYNKFKEYFDYKFKQLNDNNNNNNNNNNSNTQYVNILNQIEKIKSVILSVPDQISLERVKVIDRKLIFLLNPEKEKEKKPSTSKSKKESAKKPTKKKIKTDPSSNETIDTSVMNDNQQLEQLLQQQANIVNNNNNTIVKMEE